ncbi:MAG: gliding motility-associated C-terminal domain-containing protein [Bacteroidetes bacterium]|nr:gliding motility-associated C-terminal domain-containing protein [Bacteroidota bacterium]
MKYKISLILIIFLAYNYTNAQNQANIWHFGLNTGIDFNTGEPLPLNYVPHASLNANASICDSSGNFLFSCSWNRIWNRNGQVMQNGDGLIGHRIASQGALILQKPGSSHLYYVFTVAYYSTPIGMHYSVVDIDLDGGMGAVTDEKNILLDNTWDVFERMTSVRHANGHDIWVIVRKFDEDAFASYLLTATGLSPQVVLSPAIDRNHNGIAGNMKVSHNKKHLVVGNMNESAPHPLEQSFEICTFNAITGEIGFLYTLTKNGGFGYKAFEPWAVEFSPDSKLLYLAYFNEGTNESMELYQYDMQYIEDSLLFFESEIKIAIGPTNGLQLARDGKIYCTGFDYGSYDYVSVIHDPWKRGTACNYEADAVYLGGKKAHNFLNNVLTDHLFRFEWNHNCSGQPIAFQPNFIPEPEWILWDFGDSNTSSELWPVHSYDQGGEYEVNVHVRYPPNSNYPFGRTEKTSRVISVIESPHPNLGPDTLMCEGSEITLNAGNEQGMYGWSNGSFGQNMNTLTVSDTGYFWVKLSNSEGCSTIDSIHVGWFAHAVFNENNLVISPTSCGGSNGSIIGLIVTGTQPLSFEWFDGSGNLLGQQTDLNNLSVGNYFLHVNDGNGCLTVSDAYTITDAGDILITSVDYLPSHCLTNNGSISITATSGAGNDFSYSIDDGDNWQTDNFFENLAASNYFVRVKDQSGCETVFENNPVIISNVDGPQINSINLLPEIDYLANGQIEIEAIVMEGNVEYSIDGGTNFQNNDGLFTGLSAGIYNCVVRDEFLCDTTFIIEIERIISQIIGAIAGDGNTCIGNATSSPLLLNNFINVDSFHVKLIYDQTLLQCDGYIQVYPDLEDGFQATVLSDLGEVHIAWKGSDPLSIPGSIKMTELVFSAMADGLSQVHWIADLGESQFFNEQGEELSVDYQFGNIRIFTRPDIIFGDTKEICEGESIFITPFISGGSGEVTYEWTGPDNYSNNSELLWINNVNTEQAGIYTLVVNDIIDCVESKSIDIIVVTGPSISFASYDTLWVDPGYLLDAGEGASTYLWNTGENTSSIVIDSMGYYQVEVTSYADCKSSDSVQILWGGDPFYLPNAFTPNGDGLNDTFGAIPKYDYINKYHISIFNRWGQMIFESTDINNGWDGTYKGTSCMMGSYVYRIVYSEFGNQPMDSNVVEGSVMLIR